MRRRIIPSVLMILLVIPVVASAHSGRTDSNGGHTDSSTGEYHYHHGYSAHDHYDMDGDGKVDCPYEFRDKTNHSSNNNSQKQDERKTTTQQTTDYSKTQKESKKINSDLVGVIVYVLIIILSWVAFVWFCSLK